MVNVQCSTSGDGMNRVDTSLIERVYAPVVGWVQDRLGLDQWRLSIECLNGTVAFYLAGVALTISSKGVDGGIFVDLLTALLWLAFMELARRVAMRQAGSSLGRQSARMQESIFRQILVALLPLSIFYMQGLDNLCHTVSLMMLISHLYFKACDAPPPRRQGKRQIAYARG